MKILLINNFYYNRGGDCTYFFNLKKLLEEYGHEVCVFSMHHPQNYESKHSKYFVSYINYDEEINKIGVASGIRVLKRTIYAIEARRKIEELIACEKPDIAHVQNIHHHITPSIFIALKNNNIPIIWTLHDYTIICPNTSFLSHGKICEKCKTHKYYWSIIERCKKNSMSASLVAALETAAHRFLGFHNIVDMYIAPTEYIRNKFLEYGFNKKMICHLDLFTDYERTKITESTGDYYLFVGRLSSEKGIMTLIDAAVKVNSCKLKIAGSGPLLEQAMEYAHSKDSNDIIEFLGHKNHDELNELYSNCKFIVVPSEWYEIAGLIIFEAFTYGKPAIGSNIGGIPSLIKDMERGLLFETWNSDDLSAAIKYLLNNPDLVEEMGKNAMEFVEQEVSPEYHYEKLMEIYEQAISFHS